MQKFFLYCKVLIITIFFILFFFLSLNAPKKISFALNNGMKEELLDLVSYCKDIIKWAIYDITDLTFEKSSSHKNIIDAMRLEIAHLKKRKDSVFLLKTLLTESERENFYLRKMLRIYSEENTSNAIGAFVIDKFGISVTKQIIHINKGKRSGVKKGDPVISYAGVVGKVMVAGKHNSEVLLLSDPSSSIHAIVQRSRLRGMLKGLKFFSFDNSRGDIKIGDVVIISRFDSGFSEGIPIGIVVDFKNNGQCACIEADIEPLANLKQLEEVIVLAKKKENQHWSRNDLISILNFK